MGVPALKPGAEGEGAGEEGMEVEEEEVDVPEVIEVKRRGRPPGSGKGGVKPVSEPVAATPEDRAAQLVSFGQLPQVCSSILYPRLF